MSKTAELIQAQIKAYKANPLVPLELTAILNKFNDPECSCDTFKSEYKRDPIISWYLITAAAEATKTKINHPFAADHSMSTIGIGEAKNLFSQLKRTEKQQISIEVKHCLTSSLLAAELAGKIAPFAHGHQQAYWSALYYNLPETLLWYLQPKSMWRIYYRQLTIPKKQGLFEESKLGFSVQKWQKAITSEFKLTEQNQLLFDKTLPSDPKELIEYLNHGHSDKTPSLDPWYNQEALLILLVNRLARSILIPWHARSFQHIFKMIQQFSKCDTKKLNHAIDEAIRSVSENLIETQLLIPAVTYLLTPGKPQFPEWITKPQVNINNRKVKAGTSSSHNSNSNKPDKTVSPNSEFSNTYKAKSKVKQSENIKTTKENNTGKAPSRLKTMGAISSKPTEPKRLKPISAKPSAQSHQPSDKATEEIIKLIQKLLQQANKFESSSTLIQEVLKSIISTLGFDRSSFLLVNYKSFMAQTKLALSAKEKNGIHPDFSFKQPSPLSRFIEKQSFHCFSREQHKKIWRQFPETIQRKQVEHFMLFSIKTGAKVNAIIYADSTNAERFTADSLSNLKRLLKAVNKSLIIRAESKN